MFFKHIFRGLAAMLIVATSSAFLISVSFAPRTAVAAVTDWQKGVSISSRWNTDFSSDSFKQAVQNAHAMGANYVALIIPWYQSNLYSSDINPGPNAPDDQTLGTAIDYIHGLGMKVALKPHLESWTGEWRAMIDASDRDSWYANYSNQLNHLGDIAKAHGAEEIVVGTELIHMASPWIHADNTTRWQTMITSLRSHYSGALTYSANWGQGNWTDEFEAIGFWGNLDYIGISAYFDLTQDWNDISVTTFENTWRSIDQNQIGPLQARYGKPVLFTEVGYKSVDGAQTMPWNHDLGGNYNPQVQVNAYQALMDYWNGRSYMAGALIWDWNSDPNYGGQWNTDYTPHLKPAESTIQSWFGGTAATSSPNPTPTPTPTPTPQPQPSSSTGDYSATSQAPSNIQPNSSANIPVTISTTGQAQNVVTDIEIYDSSSNKTFQQFFNSQNISSTNPGQYTVTWTPSNAGNYTLKTGVFNSDWSTNYYWNNNIATLTVGQTPPTTGTTTSSGGTGSTSTTTTSGGSSNPPPTGPTATDVWWPSDGSTVSGVQPFKAMLENRSVSDYQMYWQVDGDVLNGMSDNQTDWPHKEALVDLSNWTWKNSGPYTINFVSKDASGNVISQKAVTIYVTK